MQTEIKVMNGIAKIGDTVDFKCDVEQVGVIIEINGDMLTLENEGGFDGGYIGGDTETEMEAWRCEVRAVENDEPAHFPYEE